MENNTDIIPDYFDDEEFECKCGCGLMNITLKHRSRLNMARHQAGLPFYVNSGSRCPERNKSEGGSKTSDHLTGEGTDIRCLNAYYRYRILAAAVSVGFKRIGIGSDFIHLGSKGDNAKEVAWLY